MLENAPFGAKCASEVSVQNEAKAAQIHKDSGQSCLPNEATAEVVLETKP
jgi:hypothetical protein